MTVCQCEGGSTGEWHHGGLFSPSLSMQSLPSKAAKTRPDHNLPSSHVEHFLPSPNDHLSSSEVEHLSPNPDDHLATGSRGAEPSLHERNRPHDRSVAYTERPRMKHYGNSSDASQKQAMDAVTDQGVKLKTTLRIFGVPATSLYDHLYDKTLTRQRGNAPVLKADEEQKLVDYIFKIQDLRHPLTVAELRFKVSLATQTRASPWSATGLPGKGWLRRFKVRHPKIATRKSQGLDISRARALCPIIAETLYTNLEEFYNAYHYPPSHIWNCDKSGVQAGRSGGATVLAKRGSKSVHSIGPNQREHLSVLSCINAGGGSIPNFYILKGTYFLQDYIAGCEEGAVMGMQPNAWMTRWLFESWISYFIECLKRGSGIDLNNMHLLVLNGHNSHVTLEVMKIAMQSGLDIISLPSHTSHALQLLDLACFVPFKTAFRKHRDSWTLVNKNAKVGKKELCEWTSKVLQCALTSKNIKLGFEKVGISFLDCSATKGRMYPSIGFVMEDSGGCENDSILSLRGTLTSTGADQVSTQGPYPGRDRGERSPPVYDPETLDRSTGHQQSPLDPGHRAWREREGSPPKSEAAASDTASETNTEAKGAEETGSADVNTVPHVLYCRLQED